MRGELAKCAEQMGTLTAERPTLMESLTLKRDQLNKQLADITEAIQALEENPQVERVLNLITKTGRF